MLRRDPLQAYLRLINSTTACAAAAKVMMFLTNCLLIDSTIACQMVE